MKDDGAKYAAAAGQERCGYIVRTTFLITNREFCLTSERTGRYSRWLCGIKMKFIRSFFDALLYECICHGIIG